MKILGRAVRRREDDRFVRGRGQYFNDVRIDRMLHIGVVRSPHPHARILRIDRSAALQMPGIVAVVAPGDYPELDTPMPELLEPGTLVNPYCDFHVTNPHYPLARLKTTYQGEPVAMVLAESADEAVNGADSVFVEYEPLPAITSAQAGMADGAIRVHDGNPNVVAHLKTSVGDIRQAFAGADFVIEERLSLQRMASMPIEGRGVVAQWDALRNEMTVWSTNQVPYRLRDAIARMLGLPYDRVRVISGDIGGAFGGKGLCPEDMTAAVMARRLGRPVKWAESRTEHFFGAHARDQYHDVRVAARRDGTILGLEVKLYKDVGSYNHYEMVQTTNTVNHILSHYRIPAFAAEGWCVVTNKVPARPSRGAGRPEASFVMDRVLDFVAQQCDMDPFDVRMRNIIRAEEMPYRNGLVYRDNVPISYDGGDYPAMLRSAADRADYFGWRSRQKIAREEGRLIGIGISSSLEAGGIGPCEGARVAIDDSGRVNVFLGVNCHGQSHETTFAQVCAESLGVPLEAVRVVGGDTSLLRYGYGTGASRIGVNAGNAVLMASSALREKIRRFAATVLHAPVEEIELDAKGAVIRGASEKARSYAQLARAANAHKGMIELGGPGLTATEFFYPETVTWSSAVHVVVVEVDPDTGVVGILKYAISHDCGVPMNPTVVDGQIQGGTVQGIGAALGEELIYDAEGQLITGSFMDYPMPRAADVPPFDVEHFVFPTDCNPLGVRATGEGGPISPPAALAAAVEDALDRRVRITGMPLTPQRVFELLHS